MRSLDIPHETFISAPLSAVWELAIDLAHWAERSPTVSDVKDWAGGSLFDGALFRLKQPMQTEPIWLVSRCAAPHELTYRTVGGEMKALQQLGACEGGTRNPLSLRRTGSLNTLFRKFLVLVLGQENASLKRRAAKLAARYA